MSPLRCGNSGATPVTMTNESTPSADEDQSKQEAYREFLEQRAFTPKSRFMVGVCKECDKEVWIDTDLRPFGMAEQCEEHEPLSHFQNGRVFD